MSIDTQASAPSDEEVHARLAIENFENWCESPGMTKMVDLTPVPSAGHLYMLASEPQVVTAIASAMHLSDEYACVHIDGAMKWLTEMRNVEVNVTTSNSQWKLKAPNLPFMVESVTPWAIERPSHRVPLAVLVFEMLAAITASHDRLDFIHTIVFPYVDPISKSPVASICDHDAVVEHNLNALSMSALKVITRTIKPRSDPATELARWSSIGFSGFTKSWVEYS